MPRRRAHAPLRLAQLLAVAAGCGNDGPATSASSSSTDTSTSNTSTLPTTGTSSEQPSATTSSGHTTDSTGASSISSTSTSTDATTTSALTTSTDSTTGVSTTGTSTGDVSTTGTSTGESLTFESTTATDEDAVCVTPTDSDTAADPVLWTRSYGIPDISLTPGEVTVAPDGAVTTSLMFRGELDLGDGVIDTQSNRYYALARHTPGGEFKWSAHIATVKVGDFLSDIERAAMAVDCAGNVIVGGSFIGRLVVQNQILNAVPGNEIDGDIIYATEDIFLMKFGPDGVRHWARRFGDEQQQRIHDIVVQTDGTIVVAGASKGVLNLGGAPIVSDNYVGLLAAFDPGGALVWQRTYTSAYDVAVQGLSIGPDDIMSVWGHAGDDTDFGGGNVAFAGDPTFIAQFEPNGVHRWSTRFFDKKHEPYRVGTDAAHGAVYSGDISLDHFVARYDANGQLAWNHDIIQGNSNVSAYALTVDDQIVLGGSLRGTHDFGGGPLITPPNETRPYLARYDLAGNHLASTIFTGDSAVFTSVDRGPDGELALLGRFVGTLDLGDGLLKSVGKTDLFIHRAPP